MTHATASRVLRTIIVSAAWVTALASAAPVRAALAPGDVAVLGWIDNGSPDSFAFVNLTQIAAGEVIYFTDNGWTGTGFRSPSGADGDGNENLIKFTAVSNIPAGQVIRTTSVGPSFTWTTSGLVPGATTGSFASLALSQSNEQITAFQGPNTLPLQNPTSLLYTLDDTNGFENATSSETGGIGPGLTNSWTATTFNFNVFNTLRYNTASLDQGAADLWLASIAHSSNWVTNTGAAGNFPLPTGTISVLSPQTATSNASNILWPAGGKFVFEVNDAQGAAGAAAGWDLVNVAGNLNITATAGNEFTLDVNSLLLTNTAGNAANFNPANNYSWTFANVLGGITGFDPAAFLLNLSGFANPYTGVFSIAQSGNNLNLVYAAPAAVPEPGTLVIWTALGLGVMGMDRWRKRRSGAAQQAR